MENASHDEADMNIQLAMIITTATKESSITYFNLWSSFAVGKCYKPRPSEQTVPSYRLTVLFHNSVTKAKSVHFEITRLRAVLNSHFVVCISVRIL